MKAVRVTVNPVSAWNLFKRVRKWNHSRKLKRIRKQMFSKIEQYNQERNRQ